MDDNLRALREPKVVLMQLFGGTSPFNLFMGYNDDGLPQAVCSDLDILVIAAKGAAFAPLPQPIAKLRDWCADKAKSLLAHGSVDCCWTEQWRKMLKELPAGEDPGCPNGLGAADVTTMTLVQGLVKATADTRAIRHAGESHNFHFPQELDKEQLIFVSSDGWSR
eukprot:7630655-Pyramimonas_sp.AAC.1